jgi:hypothetical protein
MGNKIKKIKGRHSRRNFAFVIESFKTLRRALRSEKIKE